MQGKNVNCDQWTRCNCASYHSPHAPGSSNGTTRIGLVLRNASHSIGQFQKAFIRRSTNFNLKNRRWGTHTLELSRDGLIFHLVCVFCAWFVVVVELRVNVILCMPDAQPRNTETSPKLEKLKTSPYVESGHVSQLEIFTVYRTQSTNRRATARAWTQKQRLFYDMTCCFGSSVGGASCPAAYRLRLRKGQDDNQPCGWQRSRRPKKSKLRGRVSVAHV